MNDRPIHFTCLEEIIRTRPDFDPACIITRDNFESLPGDYILDKEAPCQVESIERTGHPCRNSHRVGWLGKSKDGREGLIGSTCGPKYFDGHEGFAINRASVRRELELDDLAGRLRSIASDTSFPARVDSLRNRLRILREQSQELFQALPRDVVARLRAMAKSRDATLAIDVEFIEKIEDQETKEIRQRSRWVRQVVGTVSGLALADRVPIHHLGDELTAARNAFDALDARIELGSRKLRKQLKTFEQLALLEAQVVAFEEASTAFGRSGNLASLWLLSRRLDSQLACMRLSAIASGSPNPSNNQVRKALNDAEAALRASNNDRRVMPAQY